ncbi:SDR family oxidoreductase [Streptomyces sp. NA02950]|uniref:UDP-glucuronic acid decarboxylase family protein n=1 Tax=Streptomyces sp. NA02950 TaxID=2742137 RepID=UPI0015926795|nr:UDP-glucuronic acid decarboxylase family protein [Streptomyces sp. NA02950]QKV96306.1 SDR family oxidoreductase [Streptomyces sp. NA02950]
MASKRVLVTGGAGFIGSHLCERLLDEGHDVLCMDNLFTGQRRNIEHLLGHERFEFERHDVNEPFVVEADRIFHLACPASPVHYQRNPVRTVRTCVQGTMHALEAAREVGARLFIASTSEVYGDPAVHPQTEDYWGHVNPIGVRACYDEGKRCAEALAISYATQYGVQVRIARIFNTYGPRMHENDGRVVSNFIVQALRGEPLTLYGDGRQTRSFCYVDDLVEAAVRFMEADTDATPMNLGNPQESTIERIARAIKDLSNSRSETVLRPLPQDDPTRRCPDISRAGELLGWEPKTGLEEGLLRTIEDFARRLSLPEGALDTHDELEGMPHAGV